MDNIYNATIFRSIVKNDQTVTIQGTFEAEALRILREVPGLTVNDKPLRERRGADARVTFAGRETPIVVEFKRTVNAGIVWQVIHQTRLLPGNHVLLVAGHTTAQARDILRDHGISVVDGLGNVHLELPGLLIHIEGRRQPKGSQTLPAPTRLRGKAGLAAQALLVDPAREWQVATLAAVAGVSTALAHRVLTRLEREGIAAHEGAGPNRVRRVVNPTALLDLWAEEHTDRPNRTLAYLLAQTPRQVMEQLSQRLEANGIAHAITGAAAASLVAPFVTAVPVVDVWVEATAGEDDLFEATGSTPAEEGHNVVFLQEKNDAPLAFRERTHGTCVVNRFRLYADLLRDPRRGREQAEHLRKELIQF